ncbi:MAG: hypothetical protein LUI13_03220 [Lachnospiraceae bacterium]|nr:hypothetical protein [Lachnospiraceae bacterium]
MSDKNNLRMGLYVAAGVYLLYTAWQLYQGLGETEENPQVFAVFALLFVVGGAALIGFAAWNLYKQNMKKEDGAQEESSLESDAGEREEEAETEVGDAEAVSLEGDTKVVEKTDAASDSCPETVFRENEVTGDIEEDGQREE